MLDLLAQPYKTKSERGDFLDTFLSGQFKLKKVASREAKVGCSRQSLVG